MGLSWYERLHVRVYFAWTNLLVRLWKWSNGGFPRRGLLPPNANIKPTITGLSVKSSYDASRRIAINVFYPPGRTPGDGGEKLPIHLNVHGAAYCIDAFPTEAEFAALIALKGGCIVVDTDYAKAPRHPFPAGYHDVSDVVAYILSRPDDWDLRRFTIGGVSSGGGLALAVAAQQPKGVLKAAVTLYPALDIAGVVSEESELVRPIPKGNPGYPLPLSERTMIKEAYAGDVVDWADPRLSALYAPADAFPPVTIVGGDRDPLLPGIQKFARKMRAAGHDYEEMIVEGAGHGWERMVKPGDTKWEKLRDEAMEFFVARIRQSWAV